MGIKGLTKLLGDLAPKCMKSEELSSLMGRVLAIDASMSMYQFMIAIRGDFDKSFGNLTNELGEATSHLSGFLSRAIRLIENGIKPVYVFDGAPPLLKNGELSKRKDKREEAEKELENAKEIGDLNEIKKQINRTVKITKQHNQDIKTLLTLMGIPVINAPCEAEAQCAELVKAGKVYATATEDADALTFGSSILIRHLNFTQPKQNKPILHLNLQMALKELDLNMDEFIDFCILCGCDYCDTIRGIGPKTAYTFIKQYNNIETVLEHIDATKHPIPDNFPYKEARQFFKNPEVIPGHDVTLTWKDVDTEGLTKFLVDDNSFNAARIESYINRLKKARGRSSQMRLESFFGPTKTVSSTVVSKKEEPKKEAEKFKGKTAGAGSKPQSHPTSNKRNRRTTIKKQNHPTIPHVTTASEDRTRESHENRAKDHDDDDDNDEEPTTDVVTKKVKISN